MRPLRILEQCTDREQGENDEQDPRECGRATFERDDLRLIIESSALDDTDRLSERLAPLRHRTTRVLEAAGIECTWALQGLDQCRLDDRRGLDFLRLLQEALANVLKHSRASKVRIGIEAADGQLSLAVADNGSGFTAGRDGHAGMGLRNMEARSRRLNGTLDIRPTPGGTTVALRFPVEVLEDGVR